MITNDFLINWKGWIFLVIFLVLMIYTAYIVKNESHLVKKNQKIYFFHSLKMTVPSWWILDQTHDSIRSDSWRFEHSSPSDWHVSLQKISLGSHEYSLLEFFRRWLTQYEFEPDNTDTFSEFFSPLINLDQGWRFEGSGTLQKEQRCYLDAVLFRLKNDPSHIFLFTSQSSILDGLVEGPYFDLMLKQLEWIHQKPEEPILKQ
jgi:hypothetical protein